jgi:hypothetical protein
MGALRSKPYGPASLPSAFALAGAFALVVVAAVGGWVLAAKLSAKPVAVRPAAPARVRVGAAELELRAGWRPATQPVKLPGVAGPGARVFAPGDGGSGRMVINLLPGVPGGLPQATAAALRVPLGTAQRVKLAGVYGVGYTSLALRGVPGLADVYAIPTPAGVLAIGCVAPINDPLPVGSCPGDVLSVAAQRTPAGDPHARLKAKLPGVMAALNAARRHDRAGLRTARTSKGQAPYARRLAKAYAAAAAAVAPVVPAAGAGADLPAGLRDAGRAYGALATAAARHNRRGWARARARVGAAERVVAAAVDAARR